MRRICLGDASGALERKGAEAELTNACGGTVNDQTLRAVTANRLTDGVSVYFTADRQWSVRIGDAASAPDIAGLLAEAERDILAAVGAYPIEVEIVDGAVQPIGLRERIRAFGPTA